jgi:hypothetical protein
MFSLIWSLWLFVYCLVAFCISLCGTMPRGRADEPVALHRSELLEMFLGEGVQVVPKVSYPLPAPLLSGSLSPEAKRAKLEQLAVRHGWQRFSRPSPMAPVHVQLAYIHDGSGQRVGHHVYSAFLIYSELSTLKDQQLMESLFGANSEDGQRIGFEPEPLPADILAQVGIGHANDDAAVRFSTIFLPLMNRVELRGTARVEKLETERSTVIAWELDPRFTLDADLYPKTEWKQFANRYVKIQRDDLGRQFDGSPVPYTGCGGYVAVQETGLEPHQLLLESHLVLHEPTEWFAGSNFLRSKFPAVLQESAQTFRRRLSSNPR